MERFPAAMCGCLEQQQLEQADAADQLRDRRQADALLAELLVEEEFGTRARLADVAQQLFQAVHGGNATRTEPRAPTACATAPL
jgi:hypothetical protein